MESLLHDYGYLGIVVFLVLTGCGLPIPEEVALIAAGMLSKAGTLNPWLAQLACLIGCLLGDSVMYYLGRKVGRKVMTGETIWGRYLTPEREKMLEQLIHRHGVKVLFVARFMVGVRSPVYFTAGILKFPFPRFIIADTFCAAMVILLFFWTSYFFGNTVVEWIRQAEYGLTIILLCAAVGGAYWFWRHHRQNIEPTHPGALEKLLGESETSLTESLEASSSEAVQS